MPINHTEPHNNVDRGSSVKTCRSRISISPVAPVYRMIGNSKNV